MAEISGGVGGAIAAAAERWQLPSLAVIERTQFTPAIKAVLGKVLAAVHEPALMEDVHRFSLAEAEDQGALRIHTVMLGWGDSRR